MTTAPLLQAASGRPAAHTPVWFMRQAGRSLPEYRALRGAGSILDAIKQPDLAAELTLQPVTRYGVDAAVLFSDIVVPAHAVGFGIDVAPGTGPVCSEPLRSAADLVRLREFEPEADTPYVLETVRQVVDDLMEETFLPLDHSCVGVFIPADEILSRFKYQWFAAISNEQLMTSEVGIVRYMKSSMVDAKLSKQLPYQVSLL